MNVPVPLVRAGAAVAELLPRPPITRDQLTMIEAGDNVVRHGPGAARRSGIDVLPLDEQLRRAA